MIWQPWQGDNPRPLELALFISGLFLTFASSFSHLTLVVAEKLVLFVLLLVVLVVVVLLLAVVVSLLIVVLVVILVLVVVLSLVVVVLVVLVVLSLVVVVQTSRTSALATALASPNRLSDVTTCLSRMPTASISPRL